MATTRLFCKLNLLLPAALCLRAAHALKAHVEIDTQPLETPADPDVCLPKNQAAFQPRDQARELQSDIAAERYTESVELERELRMRESSGVSLSRESRTPCDLPEGKRFLMVVNAWEQFGGAREVLGDALAIAKQLNWVFVEPVVANGRVVSPFSYKSWLPLRDVLDIEAMKSYYPKWMSVEELLARCGGPHATPDMEVLERHEQPSHTTLSELRATTGQLVAMSHFKRKGSGVENVSSDGVPLRHSPTIALLTGRVLDRFPEMKGHGYICAQWRTEGVVKTHYDIKHCSKAFIKTVQATEKCGLWQGYEPKVFLLSDIRPETSDTLNVGQRRLREKALDTLDRKLHWHQVGWALELIKDSGQRAMVEQEICAKSRVFVGCPRSNPGPTCGNCSRMQSKFAQQIQNFRSHLKSRVDVSW